MSFPVCENFQGLLDIEIDAIHSFSSIASAMVVFMDYMLVGELKSTHLQSAKVEKNSCRI